jgi:hypothetical protein
MQKIKPTTIIEFLVILSLLGAAFLVDLEKTRFHPDENMWLNQSSHLEDFFKGNFAAFSEKKYYALTMPTIPEYVIGLSRRAGGYRPDQLPEIWDWTKTNDENKAAGHIPNKNLLWWSRLLPSLLSIASILVTFYLVKHAFNARIGYLWIILTLANHWLITALQRAMGESPLLFCITIAMLAGFLAMRSFRSEATGQSLIWLIVFGLFTGLAGQTKTNGLAIFLPGILILVLLTIRHSANQRWRFFSLGLIGLCLASFIGLVATNPFLWSDPVGKMSETIQYRVTIMNGMQAEAVPELVIHNANENIQILIMQTFKNLAAIQFSNAEYIMMALAIAGLVIFSIKTWKTVTGKAANHSALSIFLAGLVLSIPSFFTPLNIDRYYFFPVYFVSILMVVGFDWFLRHLMRIPSNPPIATETSTQPEA